MPSPIPEITVATLLDIINHDEMVAVELRELAFSSQAEMKATIDQYRRQLLLRFKAKLAGKQQQPVVTQEDWQMTLQGFVNYPRTWWDHLKATVAERWPRLWPYLPFSPPDWKSVPTPCTVHHHVRNEQTVRVCPHVAVPANNYGVRFHVQWLEDPEFTPPSPEAR